jgi:hypothetical protein
LIARLFVLRWGSITVRIQVEYLDVIA